MQHTFEPGPTSNYQITLTLDEKDLDSYKQKVLRTYQKELELPGFRKGHVPLNMVEKNMKPEFITIGVYEEGINETMKKVIDENPAIKFIGQIYGVGPNTENPNQITFMVDAYPEVIIKNDNRKASQLLAIDETVSEEEKDQTLNTLKKQHATYEKVEVVEENTVVKLVRKYFDDEGIELGSKTGMVGEKEFLENKDLQTFLYGKKMGEKIELSVSNNSIPSFFQPQGLESSPNIVVIEIKEVHKTILPEFTEENITQFFGKEITTVQELHNKIDEVLLEEKKKKLLIDAIEDFLRKNAETFEVNIPKTILDEELSSRKKSLEKRIGGPDAYKAYREKMGDKITELDEELEKASMQSLTKFFILKKVAEELGVREQIDMKQDLHMEHVIYDAVKNL